MNIFTYVKSQLAILDVAREYTTLKKLGSYWKGTCPFHHEKTASFTVSPHKEIFYCFGCHVGGDVVTFLAKVENCTPIEAAQYAAERYGIDLPDDLTTTGATQNAEKRSQYHAICKAVAQWCHEQLGKSPSVQQYVHQRGFDQNSIDHFTLGYFPGGLRSMNRFLTAMKQQNILAHDLTELHIVTQGKAVLYSPFEERTMCTITYAQR